MWKVDLYVVRCWDPDNYDSGSTLVGCFPSYEKAIVAVKKYLKSRPPTFVQIESMHVEQRRK